MSTPNINYNVKFWGNKPDEISLPADIPGELKEINSLPLETRTPRQRWDLYAADSSDLADLYGIDPGAAPDEMLKMEDDWVNDRIRELNNSYVMWLRDLPSTKYGRSMGTWKVTDDELAAFSAEVEAWLGKIDAPASDKPIIEEPEAFSPHNTWEDYLATQ